MNNIVSLDDLQVLISLHAAATDALGETISADYGPVYPHAIKQLMDYITSSNWSEPQYDPRDLARLEADIANATLSELRCILTGFARSERFSPGMWQQLLEDDCFSPVFTRASALLLS